jgi:hypothetical protein
LHLNFLFGLDFSCRTMNLFKKSELNRVNKSAG